MNKQTLYDRKGIEFNATITGDCITMLEGFVIMAFKDRHATHYKIEEGTILLKYGDYRAKELEFIKLPYPLTNENAVDFIHNWLTAIDKKHLTGSGQQLGFHAELKSHGDFGVKITGHWIYYGK